MILDATAVIMDALKLRRRLERGNKPTEAVEALMTPLEYIHGVTGDLLDDIARLTDDS